MPCGRRGCRWSTPSSWTCHSRWLAQLASAIRPTSTPASGSCSSRSASRATGATSWRVRYAFFTSLVARRRACASLTHLSLRIWAALATLQEGCRAQSLNEGTVKHTVGTNRGEVRATDVVRADTGCTRTTTHPVHTCPRRHRPILFDHSPAPVYQLPRWWRPTTRSSTAASTSPDWRWSATLPSPARSPRTRRRSTPTGAITFDSYHAHPPARPPAPFARIEPSFWLACVSKGPFLSACVR